MDQRREQRLHRNIRLWGMYKIFTKRVFLPLTTIYATQQAGLNIQQIGLTAAAASVASVLCDTATGYWADVHGRKKSAQVGSVFAMVASLLYVVSANFTGILLASLFLAIGYSFLNGAMEALVHDSLALLKVEDQYARIASRAQALSLLANAALVAVIPLLYPIDKRLPFIAGFFAYGFLLGISSLLLEPRLVHHQDELQPNFMKAVRQLITTRTILFYICIGLILGIGTGTADVFNLGFLKLALQPKYFGLAYAGASIFGAFMGLWVHHLKRLSFQGYATFDLAMSLLPFIAFGIIRSLPLAIVAFIINLGLWRYENILYQHYVLQIYGTSRYKATVISLMTNFRSLHETWLAFALASLAKQIGVLPAIGYWSILLVGFWPIFMISISQFMTHARAEAASANQ